MKPILTILFIFLTAIGVHASELIDGKELFSSGKEICLTDGSSIYIFMPDNTFVSEPLGLSGRTINGKWDWDSHLIRITGTWSWINGLSPENDFREMDIHIGHITNETSEHKSMLTAKKHRIYKSYFYIDRLEKKK
tara:strand:- start:489 stop:896 length:408 start_codon:yes stop_codon:yes gene_type:complete